MADDRAPYGGGNAVIDGLPKAEWTRIGSLLTVELAVEASVLHLRDAPLDAVYFPIDSVFSIVVELNDGNAYEIATVGRGGALGLERIIGASVAARSTLCQASGQVARMAAADFDRLAAQNSDFLRATCRAIRSLTFVGQQSVACNAAHDATQRCARWILMTRDQIGRDHFPVRPEFISMMLGIDKSDIEVPMRELERRGAVEYGTSAIHVTDLNELRASACECYAAQNYSTFVETSFLSPEERRLP